MSLIKLLSKDFAVVPLGTPDWRTRLEKISVSYIIFTNHQGEPLSVYGRELIPIDPESIIQISWFTLDLDTPTEEAIDYAERTLLCYPLLGGAPVMQRGKIVGVLSKETIEEYILEADRGVDPLGGLPTDSTKYYYCPVKGCPQKELVIYYNPSQPPICPIHKVLLEPQKG